MRSRDWQFTAGSQSGTGRADSWGRQLHVVHQAKEANTVCLTHARNTGLYALSLTCVYPLSVQQLAIFSMHL